MKKIGIRIFLIGMYVCILFATLSQSMRGVFEGPLEKSETSGGSRDGQMKDKSKAPVLDLNQSAVREFLNEQLLAARQDSRAVDASENKVSELQPRERNSLTMNELSSTQGQDLQSLDLMNVTDLSMKPLDLVDTSKDNFIVLDESANTKQEDIETNQPSADEISNVIELFRSQLEQIKKPTQMDQLDSVLDEIFAKLKTQGFDDLSEQAKNEIKNQANEFATKNMQQKSWLASLKNYLVDLFVSFFKASKVNDTKIAGEAWLQKAQENITPEQKEDLNTKIILEQYANLPERARPAPDKMSTTLERMKKGDEENVAIMSDDRESVVALVNKVAGDLNDDSKKILINLLSNQDASGNFIEADKLGKDLASKNPADFAKIRDAYLNMLVDVQWSLFKKALVTEQGFASGSITIIDRTEKFMALHENYVKFVNPQYQAPGLSFASITNGQGYNRSGNLSSHWKGQVKENRIYGIDVKFNGKYSHELPTNKDQLHFAQLQDDRVFVKWEDYGTTLNLQDQSMLTHGLHFLDSKSGRTKTATRVESKMPKDITAEFNKLLASKAIKLTPKESLQVKQQGIAGMLNILETNVRKGVLEQEKLQTFQKFLENDKNFAIDTLKYRKANEVIFVP